jgi:hypothetical protein
MNVHIAHILTASTSGSGMSASTSNISSCKASDTDFYIPIGVMRCPVSPFKIRFAWVFAAAKLVKRESDVGLMMFAQLDRAALESFGPNPFPGHLLAP